MLGAEIEKALIDTTAKIMMRRGLLQYRVSEKFLRTLNRQQYYEVTSWLRRVRREVILEALCDKGRIDIV